MTFLESSGLPKTIFRCLNLVALSFLTSWILCVDFLTSTWSFLLNMVQCVPRPAARIKTFIERAPSGPHGLQTLNHSYHNSELKNNPLLLFSVKCRDPHTFQIGCTWQPSCHALHWQLYQPLGFRMLRIGRLRSEKNSLGSFYCNMELKITSFEDIESSWATNMLLSCIKGM